jgi:hypothetical protein
MGSWTGGHWQRPTGQGAARYLFGAQGGGIRARQRPEARVDGGTLAARAYGASSEASAMCRLGRCMRTRCAWSGSSHARRGGLPATVAQR